MVKGEDEHVLLNSGKGSILEGGRPSSSSSSSSSSAEENFIQLHAGELDKPIAGGENIHRSNPKLPPHAGEDASLPDSEMSTPDSVSSRFDAGNLDDAAAVRVLKESPPEQVMVRSDVSDPYRIPSTVFESRSATPMNWSVASNESLFSIHVGNSSFSRDHVYLLGRSGDLSNFPSSLPDAYPPTPPASDPDAKKPEMEDGVEKAVTTDAANANATGVVNDASDGHLDKDKPSVGSVRHSTSTSRQSDASTQSFAFPILAESSGSMKVEPESQPPEETKAADQKEAPEANAADTKWFSFCPCSFCS